MADARASGGQAGGSALVEALTQERDAILGEIRARIDAELPSYRALPGPLLDRHVQLSLDRTLASAGAGPGAIDDRELAEVAGVGAAQAQHGVPVADMLRVWRLGIEIVVERARMLGVALGIADSEVLELLQALLAWSDVGMVAAAGAHRDAEIAIARQDHERRASFARGVLTGALAPAAVGVDADAYGIDIAREHVPVRARPAPGVATHELERALGFHDAGPPRRGLCALIDGDVCGFLREAPSGAVPGVVGVGAAVPVERLAESFRLATRAMATAHAFGLSGVFDLDALGLRPAIVADRDVTDALQRRYLTPLAATAAGAAIVETLRVYLDCGLHVERAAEQLFVHPNTLRYRISRFEELTGTSLRDVDVLAEVWWALQAPDTAPGTAGPETLQR